MNFEPEILRRWDNPDGELDVGPLRYGIAVGQVDRSSWSYILGECLDESGNLAEWPAPMSLRVKACAQRLAISVAKINAAMLERKEATGIIERIGTAFAEELAFRPLSPEPSWTAIARCSWNRWGRSSAGGYILEARGFRINLYAPDGFWHARIEHQATGRVWYIHGNSAIRWGRMARRTCKLALEMEKRSL